MSAVRLARSVINPLAYPAIPIMISSTPQAIAVIGIVSPPKKCDPNEMNLTENVDKDEFGKN
jgi:hypothetical protein